MFISRDMTFSMLLLPCLYVFMYVIVIVATPFNLQLENFGITFLMWLSNAVFLKFLKKCLQSYCLFHFFYKFSLLIWRAIPQKPKEAGVLILFANKLIDQVQKFKGKMFAKNWPGFFLCLFDFQIVSPVNQSHLVFEIDK